jgi:formamidopyrimidine-DNA glycosylase
MPELPEVETIAAGLRPHLVGRRIDSVSVRHLRAVRRDERGPAGFAGALIGRLVTGVRRRGKYLWLVLDDEDAVLVHLGMSGQLLLSEAQTPAANRHLRLQVAFHGGLTMHFVDQRTFGHMLFCPAGAELPDQIRHIARDPFDPDFDPRAAAVAIRRRSSEIKRVLLDQTVVSGIGNIYADESLWRARMHFARRADRLSRAAVTELLGHAHAVMAEAVRVGGTSFDDLYVDVNGQSGYFARGLDAYGREGQPCRRCTETIRRASFTNRSSFFCPACQRPPRRPRTVTATSHRAAPASPFLRPT